MSIRFDDIDEIERELDDVQAQEATQKQIDDFIDNFKPKTKKSKKPNDDKLRKMSRADLIKLATKQGLKFDRKDTKEKLLNKLGVKSEKQEEEAKKASAAMDSKLKVNYEKMTKDELWKKIKEQGKDVNIDYRKASKASLVRVFKPDYLQLIDFTKVEGVSNEVMQNFENTVPSELAQMRSKYKDTFKKISNVYYNNFIKNISDIKDFLYKVYDDMKTSFKMNVELGYILMKNKKEFEVSPPNLKQPINKSRITITSRKDMTDAIEDLNLDSYNSLYENFKDKTRYFDSSTIFIGIYSVAVTTYQVGKPVGSKIDIPECYTKKKAIFTVQYDDNLCFWRCYAIHLGAPSKRCTKKALELCRKYYEDQNITKNTYRGFHLSNLVKFTEKTGQEVEVFKTQLNKDENNNHTSEAGFNVEVNSVHKPLRNSKDSNIMNLLIYYPLIVEETNKVKESSVGHFMYVPNDKLVDIFNVIKCGICGQVFKHKRNYQTHISKSNKTGNRCSNEPIDKFVEVPTIHKPKENFILHFARKLKIKNFRDTDKFIYKYFIAFDFESRLEKSELKIGDNTKFTFTHIPVSCYISSNLFIEEKRKGYFIVDEDPRRLVSRMFEIMYKIAEEIREKQKLIWREICNKFLVQDYLTGSFENDFQKFNKYLSEVPVIGYNSSFYDINLTKDYGFIKHMLHENLKQFELQVDKNEDFTEEKINERLEMIKTRENKITCIKNNNRFVAIGNGKLIFLDQMNYLGAGTSLENFTKAYAKKEIDSGIVESKGFFPYEKFNDYEWLSKKDPFVIDDFYSELKGSNTLKPPNSELEKIEGDLKIILKDLKENKKECGNKTTINFKKFEELNFDISSYIDFYIEEKIGQNLEFVNKKLEEFNFDRIKYLEWYNSIDVNVMMYGIENFRSIFTSKKLDIYKDGFTIPGIAEKMMFQKIFKNYDQFRLEYFNKFKETREIKFPSNEYIRMKIKNYAKQDKEKFERKKSKNDLTIEGFKKIIRKSNGYCNYCRKDLISRNEVGVEEILTLDRINNKFPHNINNCVLACVECNTARSNKIDSFEFRESKIIDLYKSTFPVVNFIDKKNCRFFHLLKKNLTGGPSIVYNRYQEKDKTYLVNLEYDMGTNEFKKVIGNKCKSIVGYDANSLYPYALSLPMPSGDLIYRVPLDVVGVKDANLDSLSVKECKENLNDPLNMNTKDIIDGILDGTFFGFVIVDMETPKELYTKFSIMQPFFKNIEIESVPEIIGDYMYNLMKENKIKKSKTRKMIGSYHCTKKPIISTYVKWLLEKGIKITRIHGYVKCEGVPLFKDFIEEGVAARREGDVSKDKAIIADMMKLVLNSSYGKTIINKNKHSSTIFTMDENKARNQINYKEFKDLDEYDISDNGDFSDAIFEIKKSKKKVLQNVPIQIGYAVLDYAKLRMLQFCYDFIDKYIDRKDFTYCQMDTDSAYIAFSFDSSPVDTSNKKQKLEDLVKPELMEEYKKDKYNWFPRDYDEKLLKYDLRTPGLFKEEFKGNAIIALCSKMYFVKGVPDSLGTSKNKMTHKGVSKDRKWNKEDFESYNKCLTENKIIPGINKSLRTHENKIKTYEVTKTGLTFIYDKRRVDNDGVTTYPLFI